MRTKATNLVFEYVRSHIYRGAIYIPEMNTVILRLKTEMTEQSEELLVVLVRKLGVIIMPAF